MPPTSTDNTSSHGGGGDGGSGGGDSGGDGDTRRQITPLHLCALTLQPHRSPVASPDGTIFDAPVISRHLSHQQTHPLYGTALKEEELIPLCFSVHHQSGRYMCPILRRPFEFADKVVALATSGNVFSYTAIQRLNLRPRCMTDLLDASPFTLDDIVVLYDPALHRFSQFPHRHQHQHQHHHRHQHQHQHHQHSTSLQRGGRHLAFDPLPHPPISDILHKSLPQELPSPSNQPTTFSHPRIQPMLPSVDAVGPCRNRTPSSRVLLSDPLKLAPLKVPPFPTIPSLVSSLPHPTVQHAPPLTSILPSTYSSQLPSISPVSTSLSPHRSMETPLSTKSSASLQKYSPSIDSNPNPCNQSKPPPPHMPPPTSAIPPPTVTTTTPPQIVTATTPPQIATEITPPQIATEITPPQVATATTLPQVATPSQVTTSTTPPPKSTSKAPSPTSPKTPAENVEPPTQKRISASSSEPPQQLVSSKKLRREDGTSPNKHDIGTTEPQGPSGASSKGASSSVDKRQMDDDRRAVYRRVRKGRKGKGYVRVVTNIGHLNIELHCDKVPLTCDNFLTLAERRYYDGLLWHRVVPGFIAQTGDPTGSGDCGESAWGGYIKDEIRTSLNHDTAGVVSMANSGGRDTNRSQWFVCLDAAPHLDGAHSVFGKVVGGLYVLKKMETEASMGHPLTVERIEVLVNPIRLAREQIQAERVAAAAGGDAAVAAIAARPMPLGVLPPTKPSKERRSSTLDKDMDHVAPAASI